MKIVIAGAGAVGFHLATLLSKENQDITLIDNNKEILNYAYNHLDVMTVLGDAGSIEILEQSKVKDAKLFIAVTTSEKDNLLLAIMAKQMGAKKTIARVNNPEYYQTVQKGKFKKLGIDVLISPLLLAVQEIKRLIKRASFTDSFEFEHGKISIVGFTLDTSCPLINKTIREIKESNHDLKFRGVALLRNDKTLIPRGSTPLKKGDHLYIATSYDQLDKVRDFAGKQLKPIKHIMIMGDTPLAIYTAQALENKYSVTLAINDKDIGKKCLNILDKTLVVNINPGNIEALKEEGLENMDAVIALTPNSETNIIACLMAEEIGVYKTIALVNNVNYTHISQNIGIDTIINKKLIAANNIFRFVRKGKVEAIAGLHGVDAEIIEFTIHRNNRLIKNPIKDLNFPDECVIAGVVRGNKSYIPNGDFCLNLHDKVIILTLPEAIKRVEKIFK